MWGRRRGEWLVVDRGRGGVQCRRSKEKTRRWMVIAMIYKYR